MRQIESGLRATRPVARLTESDRRCVHSYNTMPPLSNDGRRLLYFRYNGPDADRSIETLRGHVMVAESDGANPREVFACTAGSPSSGCMQQWVGDTHLAAFTHRPDYGAHNTRWVVIDTDTGDFEECPGHLRSVSADGEHALLQTGERIHAEAEDRGEMLAPCDVAMREVTLRGDDEVNRVTVADVIAEHPDGDLLTDEHLCIKQPQFSPDGEHISFVISNSFYLRMKGRPRSERRHELILADRDGSNLRPQGAFGSHPSWLPDSSGVVTVMGDTEGIARLWLFPVDGSGRRLFDEDLVAAGHPSVQPGEMRYIAIDYYDRDRGVASLGLYDTHDSSTEIVVEGEYEDFSNEGGTHLHPAWSPDGSAVFFNSANSGPAQLYRADVA